MTTITHLRDTAKVPDNIAAVSHYTYIPYRDIYRVEVIEHDGTAKHYSEHLFSGEAVAAQFQKDCEAAIN